MGNMKISCEEASTICTKSQYGEASVIEKIKLNMHFMFCKFCRRFASQNSKLTDMCSMARKNQEAKTDSLSEEFKAKLKSQIKEFDN